MAHDVFILPFRVENILPDKSLEYFIGNVHWLDALTPPLEKHIAHLAAIVQALLKQIQPREAQPALQPPPQQFAPGPSGEPVAPAPAPAPAVTQEIPESVAAEQVESAAAAPACEPRHPAAPQPMPEMRQESERFVPPQMQAKDLHIVPEAPAPKAAEVAPGIPAQEPPAKVQKPVARRIRRLVALGLAVLICALLGVYFGLRPRLVGARWTARNSGTQNGLTSIFGTPDGKHLWAVGQLGIILESDDEGATWMWRNSGTHAWLESVFGTSDGRRLWAVGDGGTILESNDGGGDLGSTEQRDDRAA